LGAYQYILIYLFRFDIFNFILFNILYEARVIRIRNRNEVLSKLNMEIGKINGRKGKARI